MTKIEQIKAEIERLKRKNAQYEDIYYSVDDTKNVEICRHRRILCERLLSFIESLEKKQSQGLDEAATKYQLEVDKEWNRGWSDSVEQAYVEGVNDVIGTSIGDAFKAGAKWRDSQIPRLSNNIDEAAKQHVIDTRGDDVVWDENARGAMLDFKAGAKWRDEQITKIPDNIHEAAVQFAQRGYSPFDDPYEMNHVFENDVACFEAGAKWVLEQLKMEE